MNQELPQQKKGMSTGCIVALIIVGVLVIILVIGGIICYQKAGDLMQFGTVTMIGDVKERVAENPEPGVDTVEINRVADAAIAHVQAMEDPNAESLAGFVQDIQHLRNDDIIDSLEAQQFVNAVYRAFPEIAETVPPGESAPADSIPADDTTGMTETE